MKKMFQERSNDIYQTLPRAQLRCLFPIPQNYSLPHIHWLGKQQKILLKYTKTLRVILKSSLSHNLYIQPTANTTDLSFTIHVKFDHVLYPLLLHLSSSHNHLSPAPLQKPLKQLVSCSFMAYIHHIPARTIILRHKIGLQPMEWRNCC